MMAAISGKLLAKASVFLLGMMAIFAVLKEEISAPLIYHTLRGKAISHRLLTLDLGGGNCEYERPPFNVPEEIEFHKTLIAGYPSGDKRMIFVQMEALTGWPAKDEWDFQFIGITNNPFIKANYPHHEGIWGWGDVADQMVLMVRNMRKSMVEYHDILWDIGYAKTWEDANLSLKDLYAERAPIEEFFVWRDDRIMDEVHWYGWEIDYWMEAGLLRDMFKHGITTAEHFKLQMDPVNNHRSDIEDFYANNVAPGVADGTIGPTYDTNCANGFITDGCAPVDVLSAEKLRDYTEGPAETERIANVLLKDDRMGQYVIAPEAWDCVWEELIVNGKGLKTVFDRPGYVENDYSFSAEMLEEMIHELDRLITKYGGSDWNTKDTANRIVALLVEHRTLITTELNEVNTGVRQLTDKDFLGPKERQLRRALKLVENSENESDAVQEQKDYSGYFNALEKKLTEKKRSKMRQLAGKQVDEEIAVNASA